MASTEEHVAAGLCEQSLHGQDLPDILDACMPITSFDMSPRHTKAWHVIDQCNRQPSLSCQTAVVEVWVHHRAQQQMLCRMRLTGQRQSHGCLWAPGRSA